MEQLYVYAYVNIEKDARGFVADNDEKPDANLRNPDISDDPAQ